MVEKWCGDWKSESGVKWVWEGRWEKGIEERGMKWVGGAKNLKGGIVWIATFAHFNGVLALFLVPTKEKGRKSSNLAHRITTLSRLRR